MEVIESAAAAAAAADDDDDAAADDDDTNELNNANVSCIRVPMRCTESVL